MSDAAIHGGGWIIADYRGGGARYGGESLAWSYQPIVRDPFTTKEAAEEAAGKL